MTIYLRYGKVNTRFSEIEAGLRPENVQIVRSILIVLGTVCITGSVAMEIY